MCKAIGVYKLAKECGLTAGAIYKWVNRNSLPRTEFTGETNYSEKIAELLNYELSAEEVRELGKPNKNLLDAK